MKKLLFLLLITHYSLLTAEAQWIQYPSGNFNGPIYFVQFITNIRGFLGGNCIVQGQSVVFETYNGGSFGSVHLTNTTLTFYDFNYINSNNIFLVGSQKSVIKYTGSGWEVQIRGTGNYYSISGPTLNTIYVVGDSPNNINKSKNGGNNWTAPTSPTTNILKGVYFIDELTGWICGQSGTLYKTINGGTAWIQQSQSPSINFEKILFINSKTGIVVGSGGSISKTTNGGTNWISKQSNLTTKINSLCFYSPDLFWAAGDAGKIIKSSNSGETWFLQNTNNAAVTFNDIFFPSKDTGYAVTSEGVMYKTLNSGGITFIQPISIETPNHFSLSQNYPNPFNPTTKIKFSLPRPSEGGERAVRLEIYDILGREVTTLVNEQLKPGTYEVRWDASNEPSGVYYYKLITDVYTETKKMMLVK